MDRQAEHPTLVVPATPATPPGASAGSFSPDVHRDLCRRLAGVALAYSGAYTVAYGTALLHHHDDPAFAGRAFAHVVSLASIAMGLVVFWLGRGGRIPARTFMRLAVGFEILGAIGIMASAWGWERLWDEFQHRLYTALASNPTGWPQDFLDRMRSVDLRLVGGETVWVSVWLLSFAMLLPAPPRRAFASALATALTVPAVTGLSVLVNGVPDSVRPWLGSALFEATLPGLITVGIATFASHVVYQLARQLSAERLMGSYRLTERIGQGGMGEVWRAHHRLLARPAAVKLVRSELFGRTGIAPRDLWLRFEKEAQATATLRSVHTIELYDFGVAPDGTFYYVMELLDGFDFETLVTRHGPLPPGRAIDLLQQVCASLEEAHRAGLVHRDIKPSNILACRYGLELDFVKVLDFGLVKGQPGPESGTPSLQTAQGLLQGTPAYMAPEMAQGGDVDGRADLYSLGCVGFWLLTGRNVFAGETPMATLVQHVRDEPAPPSRFAPQPLPSDLDRLVLDCLRKDPRDRPETARAVAERLERCKAGVAAWTAADAAAWWAEHSPDPRGA